MSEFSERLTDFEADMDVKEQFSEFTHQKIYRYESNDFFIDVPLNEFGKKNGVEITFDKRIQKIAETTPYKDGKKNGLSTSFFYNKDKYKDGRIETPYVDDKRNGTALWYVNGVVLREEPFKDDKQHGTVKDYKLVNGKRMLWAETPYKNGLKDGIAVEYCDDGETIKKKTAWKNGEIDQDKQKIFDAQYKLSQVKDAGKDL